MAALTERSAAELSGMLAAGEVGAVELMQATLARIAAANGEINAVVSLREEDALLAAARQSDNTPRRGWLQGIPLAVKDLVATEGIRTTWGSPLFADCVPQADDVLAARLKRAGAILIGKTNTPEFGLGSHSYNPVHGVTRNPYDLSRSAGGSSGGAGAALAARMVCAADGSDMMGSLRNPAAWNNVYGLRPSHGLVPGDPAGEMFLHPLSTLGPMARCPGDMAALLETLAGPDPLQPTGAAFDAGDLRGDLRGKRIGWLGDWGGALPTEEGLLEAAEDALRQISSMGAAVEPVPPPFPAEAIWESWVVLRNWAVAGKHGALWDKPGNRDRMKPELIWEIEQGFGHATRDILRASARRSDWFRAAARLLQSYDALVLPSAQVWPFPAEWHWPHEVAGQAMDTYHRWMQVVVPVSLIGLPAVNLPAGFGTQGLPAGIQLFGPRGADLALLRMAQAYHEATDWPRQRPPALAGDTP